MSTYAPQLEEIAQFLQHTEIFQDLAPEELEAIARSTSLQEYAREQVIVRQGDPGTELFIIAQGLVEVVVEDPDLGIEQPVLELAPGQSFGEMSLLSKTPRSATIRARHDTVCVVLSQTDFDAILQHLPRVAVPISRYLAARLYKQCQLTGFRFVSLLDQPFQPDVYSILPHYVLERNQAIPLRIEGDTLHVAMTRPNDPSCIASIRDALPGLKLEPLACGQEDYLDYLRRVIEPNLRRTGQIQGGAAYQPADLHLIDSSPDREGQVEFAPEFVNRILNEMLAEALSREASDIHMEPGPQSMQIRFRVDGRLMVWDKQDIPYRAYYPVVRRIKILSGMDISVALRPQDGSGRVVAGDKPFDFRVSTIPTKYGEKVVIRLLDPARYQAPLSALIPSEPMAQMIRSTVLTPGGMTVVVGPTGSGKTTTLYAALRECFTALPDQNLVTVEDPIEYTVEGITQTEVNLAQNLGFAALSRAMLRQDPDIVMVGEIRDAPTAQVALEAALTGHTVLTSLHAEHAVMAIARLQKMGCQPYLIASALDLVVAQRLLRQICPACRVQHTYNDAIRRNLNKAGYLTMELSARLYRGQGCGECQGTGYRGRIAAFEVVRINDTLRDLIGQEAAASVLRDTALKMKSMAPFKHYAGFLIQSGRTTPSEALRFFGS
ncbi:MAG: Flp pilus assembly complex ATPase component TadA [Armatimonadetes bacterium]|nr:Flp pilus assembly complex ATPase component TadA [Armatimonadota bacterium]